MLLLLLALGSQVPAPCPQAAAAARETDAGWRAYLRAAVGESATHFAVADSLCPGDHATLVGLGFVFLRHGQARAGAERFLRAVASDASDADAWYGLGLARSRLGQRAVAVDAWRRTLRLAPAYADAEQQLLALGIDSSLALPAVVRPVDPDVAARTAGDGFEIHVRGGWRPLYVQGINIGVALPGHFPSEFPTDDLTYHRWLELIAEARANALRVYTILPPAFYRALKAWNDAHSDRALWLLHGVWTEPPPGGDHARGGAAAAPPLRLPAQPPAQGIRQRPGIARCHAGAHHAGEPGGLFRVVSRVPLLSRLHRPRFGLRRGRVSRRPVSLLRLPARPQAASRGATPLDRRVRRSLFAWRVAFAERRDGPRRARRAHDGRTRRAAHAGGARGGGCGRDPVRVAG